MEIRGKIIGIAGFVGKYAHLIIEFPAEFEPKMGDAIMLHRKDYRRPVLEMLREKGGPAIEGSEIAVVRSITPRDENPYKLAEEFDALETTVSSKD